MKPRGHLIIDEFELLRGARKFGLELPPEITQGRGHFRKRDKLFKKLGLDPDNDDHVAFLCSIVYDHLYLSKPSAATTKYGDNKDFDLLEGFLKFTRTSLLKSPSDLYRHFIKKDKAANATYGKDTTTDRFRMRIRRAAKKAVAGKMLITAKRKVRMQAIMPEIKAFVARSANRRT